MKSAATREMLWCLALLCAWTTLAKADDLLNAPAKLRELRSLAYVQNGSERQKLDLYLPENGGAPRPLVVWVHGGGWKSGNRNNCPARLLVARGYIAASIDYRLSAEAVYPAQIEDCKAAIRWLRAHAGEYGIDPKRIGVWGESAGGHLVALLGTTGQLHDFDLGENLEQSSAVQCVVDWFGPTDFIHWGGEHPDPRIDRPDTSAALLLGGTVATHRALAETASPVHFVSARSAPFLIMHGDEDGTVPEQQSEELNAALQQAGVATQLIVVMGAGHGGSGFRSPDNVHAMTEFFDRYLRPEPMLP